jgi:hypothetical protein
VLFAAVLAVAVFAGGYVVWRFLDRLTENPAVTCSLPDAMRCEDTAGSISSFPDMALDPRPAGNLIAIDVRPAPAAWADSPDIGLREAEWAVLIERDDGPPILAACVYSSEREVSCYSD